MLSPVSLFCFHDFDWLFAIDPSLDSCRVAIGPRASRVV